MPVVVHKRKPDTCDAFRIELNRDQLFEAAKWSKGILNLEFESPNGEISSKTNIELYGKNAYEGDYIVKFWDSSYHEGEPTYMIIRKDVFERDFERA